MDSLGESSKALMITCIYYLEIKKIYIFTKKLT